MLPALERLDRSLRGLVLGDGYGESLLRDRGRIAAGEDPPGPYRWTDDSEMAFSLAGVLSEQGRVEQDALAASFLAHFDERRGYGPGMLFAYFPLLEAGEPWSAVAGALFEGQGSFGNGSAMRVAPLGAYFADDLDRLCREAERSAEVTHAHFEAYAGAIAVALAAALVARRADEPRDGQELLAAVFQRVPPSRVRAGIELVYEHGPEASPEDVVAEVGNGSRVTCMDTVPFALWVAARHLGDYAGGVQTSVSQQGDLDTLAAIVGGILASELPASALPARWLERLEPYPEWFLAARTASSQP